MKRIEAVVRIDPEEAPEFFNLLANSSEVEEARVLEVNTTLDGVDNYLFAIDGDPSTFAARAPETPGVESVELSRTENGRTYALVVVHSLEQPMYDRILRASSQEGIVVQTPVVYRDGKIHGRGVGDPETLQRAIEETPDMMDVQIDVVGRFRGDGIEPQRGLSDRQREALAVALALGYYEQPRNATHDDVAGELDCAPATASEHLQKAEAKLVRAVMDDVAPTR